MNTLISKIKDYALVLTLISISAFPATVDYRDSLILILLFVSLVDFIRQKKIIDKQVILFFLFYFILTIIQLIYYKVFPTNAVFGLFIKISTAYFVVKAIGRNFIDVFVNLMVIISIVSFIFWIPLVSNESLKNLIMSSAPFFPTGYDVGNYFIYHLEFGGAAVFVDRNSGPFWEPGTFGGFLIIALIYSYVKTPTMLVKNNIILILCTLSTFSTTAYIALFIFIISYTVSTKKPFKFIFVLTVSIATAFFAFNNLPFLGDKLALERERIDDATHYTEHRTRLTSAIIDWSDFKKNPIIGRGKFEETRFESKDVATNRNNGTTDLLVIFGFFGFAIYFHSYYKSFLNYSNHFIVQKKFAFFYVIIVLLLGFSENYFLLPFFWGLCFVRYNFKNA